jgi:hypothetical protein
VDESRRSAARTGLKQKTVDGVLAEAGGRSVDRLASQRDATLIGLEAVRAKYDASGTENAAAATQPE